MLSPTLGTRVPCSICGGRSADEPTAGCMFKLFGPTSDPPYAFGLKPPFVLQPRKYGTEQSGNGVMYLETLLTLTCTVSTPERGSVAVVEGEGCSNTTKPFQNAYQLKQNTQHQLNTCTTQFRHCTGLGMVWVRTLVLHWRWLRLILLVLDVLDSNALIKSNTCAVRRMLDIATCLQTT